MVKDSPPPALLPLPRPGRLPRPKRDRKKPTRKKSSAADSIRDDRLMMRMHKDLVKLLDARSQEAGESRSRYIEKLLVAFLRMDPRNPRMDAWGRIDPEAPAPIVYDRIKFGEQWARWRDINDRLLSFRVPDDWLDDERGHSLWAERAAPEEQSDDGEDVG